MIGKDEVNVAPRTEPFREGATVLLGTLIGLLVGLPWSTTHTSTPTPSLGVAGAATLPLLFALLGGMVGFKKRKSHAFFYFSLVCVLILATVTYNNSMQEQFGAVAP